MKKEEGEKKGGGERGKDPCRRHRSGLRRPSPGERAEGDFDLLIPALESNLEPKGEGGRKKGRREGESPLL